MSARNPLTPVVSRTFPTQAGQVFRRERFYGDERRPGDNNTYLFAGIETSDAVTGQRHEELQYLFIVWQGDAFVFRTRMTEAEIKNNFDLVEFRSGLNREQMAFVAKQAFSKWQEVEYWQMGLIK